MALQEGVEVLRRILLLIITIVITVIAILITVIIVIVIVLVIVAVVVIAVRGDGSDRLLLDALALPVHELLTGPIYV